MTTGLYQVGCPKCKKSLQVERKHLDSLTRCPFCKSVFKIAAETTPSSDTRKDVLTFQTMMVDPEQFAEPEYWAKPVNASASAPTQPSASHSGIRRPGPSRKQFITKHPDKSATKVVVVSKPSKEKKSNRYRPSIQQMNAEKSTLDETVMAGGVIMLMVGVVLCLLPLIQFDLAFVQRINKAFPGVGFLMTMSGFGMVIYANRKAGMLPLFAISSIALFVTIGIAGWTDLMTYRDNNADAGQVAGQDDEDEPHDRALDDLKVVGAGEGGAQVARDDLENNPGNGKIVVDDHWNPFLVNPGAGDPDKAGPPADIPEGDFFLPGMQGNDDKGITGPGRPRKGLPNQNQANSIRTIAKMEARFRNGKLIPEATRQKYESGEDFAGTLTARGQMMGDGRAIVGFDFTEQFRSTLLTPVYLGEEKLEQTASIEGLQLAGINLAMRGTKVVAAQGVFAPMAGGRLNLNQSKKSSWVGDRSKADTYQSALSEGAPISALSVYLREEQVFGVGLVY